MGRMRGHLGLMTLMVMMTCGAYTVRSQTVLTRTLNKQFTLQAIAMLDIEPDAGSIQLVVPVPTEAGEPLLVTGVTDNSKWLNYTSAVPLSLSRDITVQLTSGTIPSGILLKLNVSNDAGFGAGTKGSPAATLTIGSAAQACISGIGGCYTGDGANNGHSLTYSLEISNFSLLSSVTASSATVTYTLLDH